MGYNPKYFDEPKDFEPKLNYQKEYYNILYNYQQMDKEHRRQIRLELTRVELTLD